MSKEPRVSVCIPAYRQPALVARAVRSVFNQSLQNFEVIVTDDSGNENVFDALLEWAGDERLIYRRNLQNLGSPENWSAAMKLARSNLIKFLHHDDWFAENYSLERFVYMMETNPELDLVFCASNCCSNDGKIVSVNKPSVKQVEIIRARPWTLQINNFIGAPSATIFRKQEGFIFDKDFQWVVDIDAYLRILGDRRRFEYIDEALVSVLSDGEHQITQKFVNNSEARINEHLYLYAKQPPVGFTERLYGLKFIITLLIHCTQPQLQAIKNLRRKRRFSVEEILVVEYLLLRGYLGSILNRKN
jgi:glycosyltransferase involved in cell wall biosynthesis